MLFFPKASNFFFKVSKSKGLTSFDKIPYIAIYADDQGPVVQSIVSITSSLRGQLVKCFMTL